MITTGSKFYFGLGAAGLLAAIVYGVVTNGIDHGGVAHLLSSDGAIDALVGPITLGYKGGVGDHIGYTLLVALALCSTGLGLVTSAFRDGDAESLAELDPESGIAAGVVQPRAAVVPEGPNYWPVTAAVAALLMTLGLAVGHLWFVVGCVLLALATVMWTVRAWAERATGDAVANNVVRERFIRPLEFPIAGLLAAAVYVYCLSRLFLALSKNGAWIAALVAAAIVFTTALVLNAKPQLRRGAVALVLIVGLLLVVAAGIVGAAKGERFHQEPTAEAGH